VIFSYGGDVVAGLSEEGGDSKLCILIEQKLHTRERPGTSWAIALLLAAWSFF
jgi:hypothetical protein